MQLSFSLYSNFETKKDESVGQRTLLRLIFKKYYKVMVEFCIDSSKNYVFAWS